MPGAFQHGAFQGFQVDAAPAFQAGAFQYGAWQVEESIPVAIPAFQAGAFQFGAWQVAQWATPAIVVVEQPTGGGVYGWRNLARIERNRRRRRELEEEADRLEMALAAEGLVEPAPEVVARHTVREYVSGNPDVSRRTQRAIDYAERAQTALAFELALRQVRKEIEDEDTAVLTLLAYVA